RSAARPRRHPRRDARSHVVGRPARSGRGRGRPRGRRRGSGRPIDVRSEGVVTDGAPAGRPGRAALVLVVAGVVAARGTKPMQRSIDLRWTLVLITLLGVAACAENQYEALPPPDVTVALPIERDV